MPPIPGPPVWNPGDYVMWQQKLEGSRIASLKWGTANAVPIVIRFWFKSPQPINKRFGVAVRNGAANRSYVTQIFFDGSSITNPYAEAYLTAVIPGDTTGTWPVDNTVGMTVSIVMFAGTTYRTAPDVWTAGNFLYPSTADNDMATNGNAYYIGNVGLYADPNKTGRAPPLEMPNMRQTLTDSQRYWQKQMTVFGLAYSGATANPGRANIPNFAMMRTTPAVSFVGTMYCYDVATQPTITGITNNYYSAYGHEANYAASAGSTVGRAGVMFPANASSWIAVDARM
jgi:hypothetical protein